VLLSVELSYTTIVKHLHFFFSYLKKKKQGLTAAAETIGLK